MNKTNPLSVFKIEKIAVSVREEFDISQTSCFPILEVIEFLFEKGLLGLQFLEDSDPILEVNTPAKYNANDNFIYVKESVLDELEKGEYRANFTLCHEFFHYLQCQVLNFTFKEVEFCPQYEDAEWQANEFAGQLLIPTALITGECDLQKIASLCKVSEYCAVTRKLYYEKRRARKRIT